MFIKPDYNLKNVYEINFEDLKNQGIKCLMFDLDSTLMISKSGSFLPETLEWFKTFEKDFEIAIISNNKNDKYIETANKIAPCRVIGKADKPNPKVMNEYLKSINIQPEQAVMIGDRPLTDIMCGKNLGCKTILVDSITRKEEAKIVRFARFLERLSVKK